jgi:hypothetical protein
VPFIRPLMGRRIGRPGLLGTVARTAVIAGTATVTANAVSRAGARRTAETEAYDQQQERQYAPEPASGGDTDLVARLSELARLRETGALSGQEFEAAKAKLLS